MNNQNILLTLILGSFFMIMAYLLLVVFGFRAQLDTVYLAILIGLICSLLSGIIMHFRVARLKQQFAGTNLIVKKNEAIIIDGMANFNNQMGKLYLTNQRIVFLPKISNSAKEAGFNIVLSKIESVMILKTANFIPKGIIIKSPLKERSFEVDYADDWRCLIEWQLLLFKSKNEMAKTNAV
ncbi:GRAM domain-containing protein [Carboxylicivirga sp. M1479]|uniref:GRAM domain-containing protein n=1 Tax=Carboxylicivirga sp. M1479 TaxID=2594476 RepID=UPI00163D5572|nr:GRAM domain-containing protein [Carboxylicivirga sp. M1479]